MLARLAAWRSGADRPMFVIINVLVNLFVLVRSFITMQVLDYRGLGLAALLQSIVLLIAALQFGFLNGGYRLICASEGDETRRINNLVYTFLGGLTLASAAVAAASLPFLPGRDADLVALLGIVGGIASLARTWMSNQMVASGALARLNRINLWSGIAALAALALIPFNPLLACLGAIVAQPLLFVIGAALADRTLLPTAIEPSRPLAREVLRAGFVVFLTGMLLQVSLQIERWYVTAFLGLEALGHLYLALLFITLFQLVPTSLDQLFLPSLVRAHRDGDAAAIKRGMGQFALTMALYCVAVGLAVAFVAQPLTTLVLPQYVGDLRYVYLLTPGLVIFALSSPFAVIFNVLIRYRSYIVAYGSGAALTAAVFLAAPAAGITLSLDGVMILRSLSYALIAVVIMFGFVLVSADERIFRAHAAAWGGRTVAAEGRETQNPER